MRHARVGVAFREHLGGHPVCGPWIASLSLAMTSNITVIASPLRAKQSSPGPWTPLPVYAGTGFAGVTQGVKLT
jgi:hypothetical protein